jgi:hypothetical protein
MLYSPWFSFGFVVVLRLVKPATLASGSKQVVALRCELDAGPACSRLAVALPTPISAAVVEVRALLGPVSGEKLLAL